MNRRMQLNNDLSAQTSFVQNYQTYLAQLVGFFVIEERVGRVSQVLSGGEVSSYSVLYCYHTPQRAWQCYILPLFDSSLDQ